MGPNPYPLFLLPGYMVHLAFNKYTIECSKIVCYFGKYSCFA